jgi:hypothetical protein
MSYCRTGPDSDVYIYRTGDMWTTHVNPAGYYVDYSLQDLYNRLKHIESEGYQVPARAYSRIQQELTCE